jgi:hypothetical protein
MIKLGDAFFCRQCLPDSAIPQRTAIWSILRLFVIFSGIFFPVLVKSGNPGAEQ